MTDSNPNEVDKASAGAESADSNKRSAMLSGILDKIRAKNASTTNNTGIALGKAASPGGGSTTQKAAALAQNALDVSPVGEVILNRAKTHTKNMLFGDIQISLNSMRSKLENTVTNLQNNPLLNTVPETVINIQQNTFVNQLSNATADITQNSEIGGIVDTMNNIAGNGRGLL